MENGIMNVIVRNKRLLIVIATLFVVACVALGVMWYQKSQPIALKKTNLSDASSDVRQKAAEQMMTPISNMPAAVDEPTAKYLENQLAFILRQKYGSTAASLTATVRQAVGFDDAGGYSMYVDVPGENETYLAYVNIQNQIGTLVCAEQAQQMDPATSHCFTLPSIDDNSFPNG